MNHYNNEVQIEKLKEILSKRRTIQVDNELVFEILGYDDMRDFTKDLGDWGYAADFTYNERPTQNWQSHLRAFLKENFLE